MLKRLLYCIGFFVLFFYLINSLHPVFAGYSAYIGFGGSAPGIGNFNVPQGIAYASSLNLMIQQRHHIHGMILLEQLMINSSQKNL